RVWRGYARCEALDPWLIGPDVPDVATRHGRDRLGNRIGAWSLIFRDRARCADRPDLVGSRLGEPHGSLCWSNCDRIGRRLGGQMVVFVKLYAGRIHHANLVSTGESEPQVFIGSDRDALRLAVA